MQRNIKARIYGLGLAIALSISGCGSQAQNSSPVKKESTEIVGTNGQLISIKSDNVWAACYDLNSMIMTVQFQNGYTYEYYKVPAEIWMSFIAAQPHPWSAVGYPLLVQGGFQYRRIS